MPKKKLKSYKKYLNVHITIHLSNFTAYKGYITEIRDGDFVFEVNQKIVKTKIHGRVYYDTRDFRDTILISPENIVKFAYVPEKTPLSPQEVSQPQHVKHFEEVQEVHPITTGPLVNQEQIQNVPLNSFQASIKDNRPTQTILNNHPDYSLYPERNFDLSRTNGSLYEGIHNSFQLCNTNESIVQQVQPITIAPLVNREPIQNVPLNSFKASIRDNRPTQTILNNHPNYPSYPQPPFPKQNFGLPRTNGSLYEGIHNPFQLCNTTVSIVQQVQPIIIAPLVNRESIQNVPLNSFKAPIKDNRPTQTILNNHPNYPPYSQPPFHEQKFVLPSMNGSLYKETHNSIELSNRNAANVQQVKPIAIVTLVNQEPIQNVPLNSFNASIKDNKPTQTILNNHPNYPSYPQSPSPKQNLDLPSTNGSSYNEIHNSFDLSNTNEATVQNNAELRRQKYWREKLMNEPLDSQEELSNYGGFFFRPKERSFQQNSNKQASSISPVRDSHNQKLDRNYWIKLDDLELQEDTLSLKQKLDEEQRYQSADTFLDGSNEEVLGIPKLRISEEVEYFGCPKFDENSCNTNSESSNGYVACANEDTEGCRNHMEQQAKEDQDGSQTSYAPEGSEEEGRESRFEENIGDCIYYYDDNYQYYPEPRYFPSTAFDSTTFNVSKRNRFGKNKSIAKFEKSSTSD